MLSNKMKRFGIGEWYGKFYYEMSSKNRFNYSSIKSPKDKNCPFRKDLKSCNKSGGVCTIMSFTINESENVVIDSEKSNLVTLCPNRFWQNNTIFNEIGNALLNTKLPTLIKEVNFLRRVDSDGKIQKEYVGKIDLILTKLDRQYRIVDWCALEIQAVYFSGPSMSSEFTAIRKNPNKILFPVKNRRPDFRSSGPKRLMPQLETKVPTLRRWGKKMVVVIDRSFLKSIAPMKKVTSLSNADIVWFVVDYDNKTRNIYIHKTIYTTLESSIEGLTAGEPISKENFEQELHGYLTEREEKLIRLFN